MTRSKIAFITGGTRGIGLGIARVLANQGWSLALNGQRPAAEVSGVLQELTQHAEVIYVPGDVSLAPDRQRIVTQIFAHFPTIHLLVNNAGVAPLVRADILDTSEESYDRVMDINLKGPFFLTQTIAQAMIAAKALQPQEFFSIINISSISATVASINRAEYCLSKAGVAMATRLFAIKLAERDIPVYEVRPGIIATDMTGPVQAKYDTLIEQGLTLQKRWGQPHDVGLAVAALANGHFPFSTGQVLLVDGGLTVERL